MRPNESLPDPPSIPEPPTELDFIGIDGQLCRWQVRSGPASGHPIQVCDLDAEHGEAAVMRLVPAALAREHLAACDSLENEVRAGLRMFARFGALFPGELRRLVGYNLERAAPFVLVERTRGRPVAEVAGQLDLEEQRAFELSLFRSLLLLAEAGVVHGSLDSRTVYWDGYDVQLADFGRSAVLGDARVAQRGLGWAAPEQRTGTGTVTARDDIWSAGMVVRYVVTGRVPATADLSGHGPALQSLLAGVFSAHVEGRPSAAEMLRRLGVSADEPALPAMSAAFIDGVAAFDRVLAEKQAVSRPAPPQEPPQEPPRKRRRSSGWSLWLMALVAVGLTAFMVVWGRV